MRLSRRQLALSLFPATLLGGCCDAGSSSVVPPTEDEPGSAALYLADQDVDELVELWLVRVGETEVGEPERLNDLIGADGGVAPFDVAEDGTFVVYRARTSAAAPHELALVDLSEMEPGAPLRLDEDFPSGEVGALALAPGDARVAYQQGSASDSGLFLVELGQAGPSAPVRIDLGTAEGSLGGSVVGVFAFAPDGEALAFARTSGAAQNVFWVDLSGAAPGEPVPLFASEGTVEVVDLLFAPNGSSLACRVLGESDTDLWIADLSGASPVSAVQVNERPVPLTGDDLVVYAPNGLAVAFQEILAPEGDWEAHDVVLVGLSPGDIGGIAAPPVRLNPELSGGKSVSRVVITPDSTRLAYVADQEVLGDFEAWLVELDAGGSEGFPAPVRMHPAVPAGGDVHPQIHFSPDSQRALLRAELEEDEVIELYIVDLSDLQATPTKLSGALPPGGSVRRPLLFTPDGTRVLYRADHDSVGEFGVWRADVAGGAPPIRLNGPLPEGGEVSPFFRFSPGGELMLYVADEAVDEEHELWLVRGLDTATPAPSQKISGPLTPGGDVTQDFAIRP